mmetsp:Transcript_32574/g.77777  ORF Transcript_32574/g.77777 Transcript_32574/m.77777 type:complete len:98 (-) Transcript_32574:1214-1507(-)
MSSATPRDAMSDRINVESLPIGSGSERLPDVFPKTHIQVERLEAILRVRSLKHSSYPVLVGLVNETVRLVNYNESQMLKSEPRCRVEMIYQPSWGAN